MGVSDVQHLTERSETAALIVAAGMSSRMGAFKPMMTIGEMSIAERVVTTFQQAGVTRIVVITGFQAELLERHLAGRELVFLRNERYADTQMFDSACMGLRYLRDKCARVLFTPVDIPLFTAATVRSLLRSDAKLACPVCDGLPGHPTMIAAELIDGILTDSGEGGLQGAFSRCSEPMRQIEVSDRGILHDADTPADYRNLLQFHNEQLIRPVVQVSLAREKPFFDTRTAMLLSLVRETGSVRMACQRMQLSYSSGWNVIRTLESQLSRPLVERSQGGSGGGRSQLTEAGEQLLACFETYVDAVRDHAETLFADAFRGVLE